MARTLGLALLATLTAAAGQEAKKLTQREMVQALLDAIPPLTAPRGERLPLYLWHLNGLGTDDEDEMARLLQELDARGLCAYATWNPKRFEQDLAAGLRLATLQSRLGLDVNVSTVPTLYSFFDGSVETAHVDDQGQPFFDTSFAANKPMGCPFALADRLAPIRAQVEQFAQAYADAGLRVDFCFSDWEIDGPLEWNEAWAHSKRCTRCRWQIPDIDDFSAFQAALRKIRSELQRKALAEPLLQRFPRCRVGNYAVYPHDGWRYWYDYFETEPAADAGIPLKWDRRSPVRPWYDEFRQTGFTFAMPVTYTWYRTFAWYDFPNPDYRWFYNMLLVGSNAAKSTPAGVPIITFAHWHTTSPPAEPDPAVVPMSQAAYQELLWHLLLRGHDALFLWSPREEAVEESVLLHQVYAASLPYAEFLTHGTPINYLVPREQGPVVSGLRLGDRVLLRRTDFDDTAGPVRMLVDGHELVVERKPGECQVLTLGG